MINEQIQRELKIVLMLFLDILIIAFLFYFIFDINNPIQSAINQFTLFEEEAGYSSSIEQSWFGLKTNESLGTTIKSIEVINDQCASELINQKNCLKVVVDAEKNEKWEALIYKSMIFQTGATYTGSFYAKKGADCTNCEITLATMRFSPPWDNLTNLWQTFLLTDDWQKYSFSFSVQPRPRVLKIKSAFNLNLGKQKGTIFIQGLNLVKSEY